VQTTGLAPVQVPAWQLSAWVHALPSSQAAPSAFGDVEHVPVTGSHAVASWHWSIGAQTTGLEPVQAPASQVSICVQAFPSLHALPSGFAGDEHAPVAGSQLPASWH
jgi:hypothetical protein